MPCTVLSMHRLGNCNHLYLCLRQRLQQQEAAALESKHAALKADAELIEKQLAAAKAAEEKRRWVFGMADGFDACLRC